MIFCGKSLNIFFFWYFLLGVATADLSLPFSSLLSVTPLFTGLPFPQSVQISSIRSFLDISISSPISQQFPHLFSTVNKVKSNPKTFQSCFSQLLSQLVWLMWPASLMNQFSILSILVARITNLSILNSTAAISTSRLVVSASVSGPYTSLPF